MDGGTGIFNGFKQGVEFFVSVGKNINTVIVGVEGVADIEVILDIVMVFFGNGLFLAIRWRSTSAFFWRRRRS